MKTVIHVNQHKIRSNCKNNTNEPVLTCKTYKSNTYAHEAIIYGKDGLEAARIIYSPNSDASTISQKSRSAGAGSESSVLLRGWIMIGFP